MSSTDKPLIDKQVIEEACEWSIMHGVAFKNSDGTARHCPFSIAPMTMKRKVFQHIMKVTPLLTKLISRVSEDHLFLQSSLTEMAKADQFFERLMAIHQEIHGVDGEQIFPARQPLLLMRTDYMDDYQQGAKVIEFNGIAAGMGPFGQRITQLHQFMKNQWSEVYTDWVEDPASYVAENFCLEQLAEGIAHAAHKVKAEFDVSGQPTFLMVVQRGEDNVYDQHLLEVALQGLGVRTLRRTFDQLASELYTGENKRLMLKGIGAIDLVYLRAGYQHIDYFAPALGEDICCQTLSQTRAFIEQHNVALNATISQQLATSKTMQMILTMMPEQAFSRWGFTLEEVRLMKSVLAEMLPVNKESIDWFSSDADKTAWVLKNQGEGGGHCVFGEEITERLSQLKPEEYEAWALMQRLFPHERERPTLAVRDGNITQIDDLISEIGLFTAYFNGRPVAGSDKVAGYLVRSKPAKENEGGIHSGQGILDSITLTD
ncbi:glutathione synthase [Shewanella woodyi]|uniref:glutathione synthase n=1 Tax=Shewanella woodyi TaxID=60961 RepID=UPI003749CA86